MDREQVYRAARDAHIRGEFQEAAGLYKRLVSEFSDSEEAELAQAYLYELKHNEAVEPNRQAVGTSGQSTSDPVCSQCRGPMRKTVKREHNIGFQFFGVALFIVGVALLFAFPIGTIVGLFVILGSARLGFKKRKVWLCQECGWFFERI